MVGFLPFQGARASCRYAVPYCVYWQVSQIPSISRTDMDPMVSCIQMDGLSVPDNLSDTSAYSRLAASTGVDYLVAGEVVEQTDREVQFRVCVYSARNPGFHRDKVYNCTVSELIGTAAKAARDIAAAVGATVDQDVVFDDHPTSLKVLRLFDESIELGTGCEQDRSDLARSSRLAGKVGALDVKSDMITQWMRTYYIELPRNIEGYRDLRRRSTHFFGMHGRYRSQGSGSASGTRTRPRQWWGFDHNRRSVQLDANGRPILSAAWRNNLPPYRFRTQFTDSGNDVNLLVLKELCSRYPRSAYIRHSSALYMARAGDYDGYLAACQAASKLNPKSYRLRMELVHAYLSTYKNDRAGDSIQSALMRWPNRSECHLLAAVLYRRWKQYGRAADEMLAVRDIDPQTDGIHEILAQDYMRTGRVVEAVREMTQADPCLRQGMITFSMVLSGVFVVLAMAIGSLAYLALRPERGPKR